MPLSSNDIELTIALDKANSVRGAIGLRGYPTPEIVLNAFASVRELDAILSAPAETPALSEDPKKLRASLTAFAIAARDHQDMLVAAQAARAQLLARAVQATRSALPAWIEQLQSDFTATWQTFTEANGAAPEYLHPSFSDEQALAHVGLLRAVADLDAIVATRIVLGTLMREENCHPNNLLLAANLPATPANPAQHEAAWTPLGVALDTWTGGGPLLTTGVRPAAEGVAKWAVIADTPGLTTGLADLDGLEARTGRLNAWTEAVSAVRARGGMPFPQQDSSGSDMWHEMAG